MSSHLFPTVFLFLYELHAVSDIHTAVELVDIGTEVATVDAVDAVVGFLLNCRHVVDGSCPVGGVFSSESDIASILHENVAVVDGLIAMYWLPVGLKC